MFESAGPRKYIAPIAFIIVIACVMSLMLYPMIHMQPKGLPFAVLSLDEGAETPQGAMNAGNTMVEAITSADNDEGDMPISWTKMNSQEELDAALENNEFYGAIVIPADFTAGQMAAKQAETQAALETAQAMAAAQAAAQAQAQAAAALAAAGGDASALAAAAAANGVDPSALAAGAADAAGTPDAAAAGALDPSALLSAQSEDAETVEAPAVQIIIDNAKSPMVANLMQSSITSMFSELGVAAEVTTIHAGAAEADAATEYTAMANPMGSMMSQQLSIMPTYMMSIACALMLTRLFRKQGAATADRTKAIGKQLVGAVVLSLLAALTIYCMVTWVGETELPFMEYTLFIWMASFCLMLVFLGAFNIAMPLGVLVAVLGMACGMITGVMPIEMLPAFWQDWVFPWAPQRFIGEGVRSILYMGEGAWNAGSLPLLVTGIVGAVLVAIAAAIPSKESKETKAA